MRWPHAMFEESAAYNRVFCPFGSPVIDAIFRRSVVPTCGLSVVVDGKTRAVHGFNGVAAWKWTCPSGGSRIRLISPHHTHWTSMVHPFDGVAQSGGRLCRPLLSIAVDALHPCHRAAQVKIIGLRCLQREKRLHQMFAGIGFRRSG